MSPSLVCYDRRALDSLSLLLRCRKVMVAGDGGSLFFFNYPLLCARLASPSMRFLSFFSSPRKIVGAKHMNSKNFRRCESKSNTQNRKAQEVLVESSTTTVVVQVVQ